jgi:hypothetical protein
MASCLVCQSSTGEMLLRSKQRRGIPKRSGRVTTALQTDFRPLIHRVAYVFQLRLGPYFYFVTKPSNWMSHLIK